MKKTEIYIIGQRYEIELGDEFYGYIKDDLLKLNNSLNPIKDMLDLVLSLKYQLYKNEQKMTKILKKVEKL